MMSIREAAESIVGTMDGLGGPDLGSVNTMTEFLTDAMLELGMSRGENLDFDGPRRKTSCSFTDMVDHLTDKYLGRPASLGDRAVIADAVVKGLVRLGMTEESARSETLY